MIGDGRKKTEPEDQPMPVVNELPFVHDAVIIDIAARGELGKRRYGTKLQPNNGRNALLDAYEEALDLACYLKQRILEDEQLRLEKANAEIKKLACPECDRYFEHKLNCTRKLVL